MASITASVGDVRVTQGGAHESVADPAPAFFRFVLLPRSTNYCE